MPNLVWRAVPFSYILRLGDPIVRPEMLPTYPSIPSYKFKIAQLFYKPPLPPIGMLDPSSDDITFVCRAAV